MSVLRIAAVRLTPSPAAICRAADLRRHAFVEEAGEIARRRALRHRLHQQPPCPPLHQRQHEGHRQDGDDLVELRAQQDGVAGEILHVVARDHGVLRIVADHVEHHRQPAERRGGPRRQHEARLEAQRPERDEDEHIEQRGRLQHEGGRLLILDMEADDQRHQQHHVHHDGQIHRPVRQPALQGPQQAHQGEDEIAAEHIGNRRERGSRVRLGRDGIERPEQDDDGELDDLDEHFAGVVLPDDGHDHALRQAAQACPRAHVAAQLRQQFPSPGHGSLVHPCTPEINGKIPASHATMFNVFSRCFSWN
ncbi:MAG: hypothetical protein AB7O70_16465 [Hyphomicrobiales bacterium]